MYYLLLVREEGVWDCEFSDFDKETVKYEQEALEHTYKRKDMKIVSIDNASQRTIDKKVAEMNGETLKETNQEMLTRVMEFSQQGAIMHAFIMEALNDYSERVKDADLSAFEGGFIQPEAWRACSKEMLSELKKHLKR